MIEYMNVHKCFDHPVLSGVDLTVRDGEILAIIGPSGTGKSVLLKITCGLLVPDWGDVRIHGSSVFGDQPEAHRVRNDIRYVFQSGALFDSLTVYENVALGIAEKDAAALGQKEVARRVGRALAEVRLDARAVLRKMPAELSGGMRKRVGIARAIVGRPRVLLYDEPVTGLDPVTSAAVTTLIVDIARDLGTTSMLTTHDVEGALEFCDRIALLVHGRIRIVGTPSQLRQTPDPVVQAFVDRKVAASRGARNEVDA